MSAATTAMLIHISQGHTGRKAVFDGFDRAVLYILLPALVVRVGLPPIDPALYLLWIQLSAACWFACYSILGWRYIPFLLKPRTDGKEH